jgi:DNA-binding response OmpR family regulator
VFDGRGFHRVAREDGSSALRALEEDGPFDLLIADIDMPGFSGVELCRHVCSCDHWLPTILITGCIPDTVDTTDLPSNVCKLVQKPFGIDALVETAERIHRARACRPPFVATAGFALTARPARQQEIPERCNTGSTPALM